MDGCPLALKRVLLNGRSGVGPEARQLERDSARKQYGSTIERCGAAPRSGASPSEARCRNCHEGGRWQGVWGLSCATGQLTSLPLPGAGLQSPAGHSARALGPELAKVPCGQRRGCSDLPRAGEAVEAAPFLLLSCCALFRCRAQLPCCRAARAPRPY